MKLRNKKTGEIIETDFDLSISVPDDEKLYGRDTYQQIAGYTSLAELNEEWEDYEEPKEHWTIDPVNDSYIDDGKYTAPDELERYEELGLKFDTKEEAEKAVEKLKAWKRLKDKGIFFEIEYSGYTDEPFTITGDLGCTIGDETKADLDLLFGGEEC